MMTLLMILFLVFPIFSLILLMYLWINSYFFGFYLVSILLFLLTIILGSNFSGTGFSPSCFLVILCGFDLLVLLFISGISTILSISRFIGLDVLQDKDTYYFILTFLLFGIPSTLNLFYTRKGYFEENIKDEIVKESNSFISVLFLYVVLCFKNVPAIIRLILLFVIAIMKYFYQIQVYFTPIMEAVVLTISLDSAIKPYCHYKQKV